MKKKVRDVKVVNLEVIFKCDNGHDVKLEQPFIQDSHPERKINAMTFVFPCGVCKQEVTRKGSEKISARLVE